MRFYIFFFEGSTNNYFCKIMSMHWLFHFITLSGWYEPLADRIASNPNITVFPAIELIDEVTLRVLARPAVQSRGVFKWSNLMFDWDGLPEKQRVARKSSAEPIK